MPFQQRPEVAVASFGFAEIGAQAMQTLSPDVTRIAGETAGRSPETWLAVLIIPGHVELPSGHGGDPV